NCFAGAALCLVLWGLNACTDSKETRIQRFLLQGNDQAKKGNAPQAIAYYAAAIELDSCFAEAWNNLGTVYYRQRNYDQALTSYDHAVSCREGYTEALLHRANTFFALQQFHNALKDLDRVA